MKLSTKGRYATRALIDLGLHGEGGLVLAREVSERIGVSENYLEQLFMPLRVAGLVRALRGARGGFALARSPSEIRVSDILQAVEGSLAPADCVDDAATCPRADLCVTRELWAEMKQAMDGIMEGTTLQHLIDRYRTRDGEPDKCST